MSVAEVKLPPKLVPVFTPQRGSVRYRYAYGGRGSGKSMNFATMAAVWGYAEPLRFLITRELQVSIRESMYAELRNAISLFPWLEDHYEIGESFIRGANGTEFLFRGLRHNISTIKSTAHIDVAVVDEAEDVPEESWRELLPTVRAEGSEIWAIWNPRTKGSPVDRRFVQYPPDSAIGTFLNYYDNPFFPASLEEERRNNQRQLDPAIYAHIWEGEYLELSEAQVLGDKVRVEHFETDQWNWDGPYHGLDYGFAQDPTAAVRAWIAGRTLYVDAEAGRTGLELDDTPDEVLRAMPTAADYVVRCDNARPESTNHIKKPDPSGRRSHLPRAESAPKWQGSVHDGVQHLRSYDEIVVHPRCENFIRETRLYRYKKDRYTGDILPQIVDEYNHWIDALRYALAPLIKQTKSKAGVW